MIFPVFWFICKWSTEHMVGRRVVHDSTTHTAPLSPQPQTHSHKTWPPFFKTAARQSCSTYDETLDVQCPHHSWPLRECSLLVRQQVCNNSANILPPTPLETVAMETSSMKHPFYPHRLTRFKQPPEDGYTSQIMISPHQLCDNSLGSTIVSFAMVEYGLIYEHVAYYLVCKQKQAFWTVLQKRLNI